MEKELYDLLNKEGEAALAKELKFDDITLDDFIAKHKAELLAVPGYIDLMQPKESKAPLGMNEEQKAAYFYDDPEGLKYYEQKMQQVNSDLSDKQKLAEEYKLSKDDSYFNTMFANDYAKQKYKQGKTGEAIGEDVVAKSALVSDFLPFPFSLYGPVARTTQMAMNDDMSLSKIPLIALDFGTSLLGPSKGAAKSAISGAKAIAGKNLGKLFETKLGKTLEKSAEAIDARELAVEAATKRKAIMETIDEVKSKYLNGTLSDKEALDFAKNIENEYPDLAKSVREHINALAANRKAATDAEIARSVNAKNAAAKEAKEVSTANVLPEKRLNVAEDFDAAAKDATERVFRSEVILDEADNLVQDVADIDKAFDLYKASKASTVPAKVIMGASKPVVKASTKVYSRDIEDNTESEYKKAIDKTIEMYKRQWQAGFTPKSGFELEAYNVAKQRGDI